jgi:multidrug efflux pump subunit AcrB
VVLGKRLPGGFLPEEDQGYLYCVIQLPDAASLQRTAAAAKDVEKIIMNTPGVEYCTSVIGFNLLSQVRATYGAFLTGNTNTFIAAAQKRPEIAKVITSLLPNVPQLFVNVDRDKVLSQGVPIASVYDTLQTFMGGKFVNFFNRFGRQWRVYVEAEGDYRADVRNLGLFYVRNANGDAVPLLSVTTIERKTGPEFTMRYNLFRSAQINVAAAPGISSAVKAWKCQPWVWAVWECRRSMDSGTTRNRRAS